MKRKIALLVSMIQLLCFVLPIGQVSADYKSQLTTEIANAYYNKACEFLKERYSGSRFSIAFYVYDIDKDGIPELIALDTVALGSMNYYFYTYSNGEVKDCGSLLTRYFEWPRTYNDGNGIVLYYVRGGDLSTAALCTLESGKISVVRNYSVDESVSSFEFGMNDLKTVVDIEFDIINNIPKRNPEEADYNAIFTAVNELVYVPEEAVVEATAINVLLNGKAIEFDQLPIIVDDRTLVPLRAIFEALGATVDWNGNTQTVTATRDNTVIKITIGDNKLYVNDKVTVLDVPAQIVNDRTLVPVRAISEAFGCNVEWDGNTKTVSIVSEPYSSAENKQEPIISEDDILQQILIQNGLNNYLYYMPDDYDGDGHKEAFVFIGSSEPFAKIKVYFINHTGECRVAVNETFGYLDEVIQAGTHKFVQWVQSAGGSGSSGILLGCRNGSFYEPEISMKYNFIYKSENGDLFGDENDFSNGFHEYIAIPLWFDDSTGEFYVK